MQGNNRHIDTIQNDLEGAEKTRGKARLVSVVVAVVVVAALAGAGWMMASRQANAAPVASKKFTPAQTTTAVPLPKVSATSTPARQVPSASGNASAGPKAKSSSSRVSSGRQAAADSQKVQTFSIAIGDLGYSPSKITASASRPITLRVAKGVGCAAGFLIKKLGIDADNSSKPVTLALGKLPKGNYRYTCGMEMVEGVLVVD